MLKYALLPLLLMSTIVYGQQKDKPSVDSLATIDSIVVSDLKETVLENIPEISIDENDVNGTANQGSGSPLIFNTRDPFFSASTFGFSAGRFRFRGYTQDFNTTYMNGMTMQTLESGFTPYGQWGGLNWVLRNRQVSFGVSPTNFGYGNLGTSVNIDTRASKQRKQTQIGYGYSTRGYFNNRISFATSTGLGKKGWAFTLAGSVRGSDEGFVTGTYGRAYAYFLGIDKKLSDRHLLSFVGFASPQEAGRAGTSLQEMQEIANDKYYNPFWGYQNGKKRNSSVARTNQPVMILTHEYKIDPKSTLTTAVGYTFGERSTTRIDRYNTADPAPDYYRNLPSYYEEDPVLQAQVRESLMNDVNLRQINWDRLYQTNRNNFETIYNVDGIPGNNLQGKRSVYVLERRVTYTQRGSVRTVFNSRVGKNFDFTFGMSHQTEKNSYYSQVDDLLGGDFYVDRNPFGERDFPNNPDALQNNLNQPNRIVKVGDKYGYDYDMIINRSAAWTQGILRVKNLELFAATELSNTQYYRYGHTRYGLFPNNSYGKSQEYSFNNYSVKGGLNYRISRRHFLYANAVQMTRAPYYRNVFISPRTRDFVQDNIQNEKIRSAEAGYLLSTPFLKFRLSGYYTKIEHEMSLRSFYYSEYNTFVNYSMNNIGRVHYGGEFGFEARVVKNVLLSGAASVGRSYYSGRPEVIVSQDNNANVLQQTIVYQDNYRVGRMPQEAYLLGLQYRSPNYWSVGANVSYFDQIWMEINPIRRTAEAVQAIEYNSKLWHEILDQQRLAGRTTMDVFANWSWKLPRSLGFKKRTLLFLNATVNNVLNNQNFIVGGFEQLRYDAVDNNVNAFPPRYAYGFGRTYSFTASIRF